jgi:hypothetical protein
MSSRLVDEYPKHPHEIDTESLKDLLEALQIETEQYREENGLLESYYTRVAPSEPQEGADDGNGETQDKGKRRRKRAQRGKQKDKTVVLPPEMKVSIVSREIDERRMTIDRVKGDAEKQLEILKAEMEEVDSEIAEVKKDAFEFRRDVVVGGENPRTGKIIAEKVVKFMEERLKQKVCCTFHTSFDNFIRGSSVWTSLRFIVIIAIIFCPCVYIHVYIHVYVLYTSLCCGRSSNQRLDHSNRRSVGWKTNSVSVRKWETLFF